MQIKSSHSQEQMSKNQAPCGRRKGLGRVKEDTFVSKGPELHPTPAAGEGSKTQLDESWLLCDRCCEFGEQEKEEEFEEIQSRSKPMPQKLKKPVLVSSTTTHLTSGESKILECLEMKGTLKIT